MKNDKLLALDEALGRRINARSSIKELMSETAIDFKVEKVPACTPEGAQISTMTWHREAKGNKSSVWVQKKTPLFYILRREDTKHILGMVKRRYTPIPLEAMLQPFHQMVKEFGASYETAGILGGGAKIWIAARMPEEIKIRGREDDRSQARIMMLLDQSGLRRNAFFTLMKRISCNNQFHLIAKTARESGYSVKHSKNWAAYLEIARQNFEKSIHEAEEFGTIANELASRPMTKPEMEHFSVLMIPKHEDESSKTEVRRTALQTLFSNGIGNLGQTRWDCLNAVTEFCDHRSGSSRRFADNAAVRTAALERHMMSNLLGGPGDIFKHRAFRILQSDKSILKVHQSSIRAASHVEMN